MHALFSTTNKLNSSEGILTRWVVDVTDPNSSSELKAALLTQRRRARVRAPIEEQLILASGLYNTHNAGFQLLKAAQPVDAVAHPDPLVILNVAEIAEAEDGRRKDNLVVGVSRFGTLIVGYAAEHSPILDPVLPFIDELFVFHTPPEWDRHQTFRSRNVLPRVAAGLLVQSSTLLERLEQVELSQAREKLRIVAANRAKAGWFDGFGQEQDPERAYNLKSAYTAAQFEEESGVRHGDTVEVLLNGEKTAEALYARSLQASEAPGDLILCQGSSGYTDREGREIRFLDLMAYGESAFEALGRPGPEVEISFRAVRDNVTLNAPTEPARVSA